MRVFNNLSFHSCPVYYFCCITALVYITGISCGQFYGNQTCGTLFSDDNYDGNSLVLKDWDQSVNLQKDYRSLLSGWGITKSILVELDCTMKIYTGTYFEGDSRTFSAGRYREWTILSGIRSVSCECSKECNCETLQVPKNSGICGMAFLKNTCNQCDAAHLPFFDCNLYWNTPNWPKGSTHTVIIRPGCTLSIYPTADKKGVKKDITGPVIQNFKEDIGSYDCNCNEDSYAISLPSISALNPISLATNKENWLELLSSNTSLSKHPGFKAARKSFESGRSHSSVYIIAFGVEWLSWIGLLGCPCSSEQIGVCRLSVHVDELGISEIELNLIYLGMGTSADKINDDARWLASLDQYMSTHPDLKNTIPNAVVVYHSPLNDTTIFEADSHFQRKLGAVNALRGRLLDENYSNLIFLLQASKTGRNPEAILQKYEEAITKNWSFPAPLFLAPRELYNREDTYRVRGNYKMESREYFFRNFHEKLLLACEKGEDKLGHAVLKSVLPFDETEWRFSYKNSIDLLPANDTQVEFFRQKLKSSSYVNQGYYFTSNLERRVEMLTTVARLNHLQNSKIDETQVLVEKLEEQTQLVEQSLEEFKLENKQELAYDREQFQEYIQVSNETFLLLKNKGDDLKQEYQKQKENTTSEISLLRNKIHVLEVKNKIAEDTIVAMGKEIETLNSRCLQLENRYEEEKVSTENRLNTHAQIFKTFNKKLESEAPKVRDDVYHRIMNELERLNVIVKVP